MADDTSTNLETGVDAGQANETTDSLDNEAAIPGADAGTEGEVKQLADDDEEVEYEGNKYLLPRELKDALLRQSDYTKKTQEVAAQRKVLEAAQQHFQQQQQLQQVALKDVAAVMAADQQLAQFKALDWQSLIAKDPVEAMRLDHQMRQIQESRNQAAQRATQIQQQQALQAQQETARRLEEGRAAIAREIKDWSPELAQKLTEHGKTEGYTEQELAGVADPRAVKLLYKAYLYDQIMSQKTKQAPKVDVKPVTKVSGQTRTVKEPTEMSTKEFAEWRRKQIAQRGR